MKLTEPGKDRNTFTCQACGSISTFTQAPDTSNSNTKPENKLSAITLRDKSTERIANKDQNKPKVLEKESIKSMIETIRKAMNATTLLSFDYLSGDNKKSSRNVEPYKLTSRKGELILFAYDMDSEGIRTFKLRNMSYLENQPYAYKPRYDVEDKLKDKDA
jgi:predicted DNA-binding transcriptional regulator YafY